MSKIEPPSCRQYKLRDNLAVRPQNWDKIINDDDDDDNWADPGATSGGRSCPSDGITMKIARVRRTRRAVRKGPGMGRVQRMGREREQECKREWDREGEGNR
jgi:hypothetical protein